MYLNVANLVQGFTELGVKPGMVLCVHSSLSAFGNVAGGAQSIIDALKEAVGSEGTLMMPTHPARDGQPFNPEITPSAMGIVSEVFRKMPGVVRSRHPYHPVAAWGKAAETLLEDHEKSPVPDGMETPFGRLVRLGGYVLMLGCDLDTMTLLHHVEAALNLPYLRKLDMTFVNEAGIHQELSMQNVPGGHRGGVLKFETIFTANGIMNAGRIGSAVCRLVSAPEAVEMMQRLMSDDPAFVLDDNPHCEDCLYFRGLVNNERLSKEQFKLHVRFPYHPGIDIDRFMRLTQSVGALGIEVDYYNDIGSREVNQIINSSEKFQLAIPILRVGPCSQFDWTAILDVAQALNVEKIHCTLPTQLEVSQNDLKSILKIREYQALERGIKLLVGNRHYSWHNQPSHLNSFLSSDDFGFIGISYNPIEALRSGIKPFYEGFYSGRLRRKTIHVDVCDGVGENPKNFSLGEGKSEIREIISNLRSRMFTGMFCLWPIPLLETEGVLEAGRQFWQLIDIH